MKMKKMLAALLVLVVELELLLEKIVLMVRHYH